MVLSLVMFQKFPHTHYLKHILENIYIYAEYVRVVPVMYVWINAHLFLGSLF